MRRTGNLACLILIAALPLATAGPSLTAGDVDDHLNWDAYLRFLERSASNQTGLPPFQFVDRVSIIFQNEDAAYVPFVDVTITPEGATAPSLALKAGTDGILRFFPKHDGFGAKTKFDLTARGPGGASVQRSFDTTDLSPGRTVNVTIPGPVTPPSSLDLMFVVDTTGSMSDELAYITQELGTIVARLSESHPGVKQRFGLTLYRDEGDEYVVRSLGFTDDLSQMQQWLEQQRSDGGGDYPEAMEQGFSAALKQQWRGATSVRILFLVADAPPHAENYAAFGGLADDARRSGVHVYPLAASGVAKDAEYLMRAAAVLTQGRYLFLTDDSGIGESHAEPSIPCYAVTSLQDLMVRVISGELSGHRVEPSQEAVVRAVGKPERGVCLGDPQGPGGPETPSEPAGGVSMEGSADSYRIHVDAAMPTGALLGATSSETREFDGDSKPVIDGPPTSARQAPGLPLVVALGAVGAFALRRRPVG